MTEVPQKEKVREEGGDKGERKLGKVILT